MSKPCEICRAEMPDKAVKCTNCGSYQGIGRRLLFGGQAAALTSLIPVLALAFAFVSTQFKAIGSDITVFEPDCENPAAVTMTASNLGDRSAVLEPRALKVQRAGSEPFVYPVMVKGQTGRHVLLPAGKITSYQLGPRTGMEFMSNPDESRCEYRIEYAIIEFDADAVTDSVTCRCAE